MSYISTGSSCSSCNCLLQCCKGIDLFAQSRCPYLRSDFTLESAACFQVCMPGFMCLRFLAPFLFVFKSCNIVSLDLFFNCLDIPITTFSLLTMITMKNSKHCSDR